MGEIGGNGEEGNTRLEAIAMACLLGRTEERGGCLG